MQHDSHASAFKLCQPKNKKPAALPHTHSSPPINMLSLVEISQKVKNAKMKDTAKRRMATACEHTDQRFYAKGLCRNCYFTNLKFQKGKGKKAKNLEWLINKHQDQKPADDDTISECSSSENPSQQEQDNRQLKQKVSPTACNTDNSGQISTPPKVEDEKTPASENVHITKSTP